MAIGLFIFFIFIFYYFWGVGGRGGSLHFQNREKENYFSHFDQNHQVGIQTHLIIHFNGVKIVSHGDRQDKMLLKVVRWPTQEQKENFLSKGNRYGAGHWAFDNKVKWRRIIVMTRALFSLYMYRKWICTPSWGLMLPIYRTFFSSRFVVFNSDFNVFS